MAKTELTITPSSWADNWAGGMTSKVQKIKDGVNRVTESPMEKAAASVDRQVEGVRRAAESGKTQAALRKVTLAEWKSKTAQKVGERLAGGVTAAKPKVQQFATEYGPVVSQLMGTVNAMPANTFEERMQKAMAWGQGLHENPYKK